MESITMTACAEPSPDAELLDLGKGPTPSLENGALNA
jgi:hypothetical protein